ncbi:beta-lactamase [Bradyrhizobium sp. CCBAU 11434]|uniref:serine hydrolase domain-containing protein n=1 Tax=Bradyrhizobium sp. CCBAU 11434 TaxID=1630885 RepID=UPI002304DFC8|nr:serine hydrolase [Bradyrhizobium sp. CCBAU 11434]MDA9521440.1 beta-lactamase [Bradyrhizobium sp. CCBAU 11434]
MTEEEWPEPNWQIKLPEAAGWSPNALANVDAIAGEIGTAALMIIERGAVVHQWGAVAHRFMCHSIRKSLLSALFGIYVAEGKIDLSSTLASLGIDDKEGLTDRERLASVNSLLMARSGVFHPTGYETALMIARREARHSHGPGTFWCYNNWDFNALGTIFEQCAGLSLFEAFRDRIAIPCGMEDFRYGPEAKDGDYVNLENSIHRAYPFRLTARDLARFGLLYLRGGRWGCHQVVPKKWVKLSVQPYSDAGAAGAYGYMWWVVRDGIHFPETIMPPGYSAQGAGGHVMMVLPKQELVLVHRVDTDEGRAVSPLQLGRLFEAILSAKYDALY